LAFKSCDSEKEDCFRDLKKEIIKDNYPLPNMEFLL
jgi:hypothetical protein